MYEPDRERLHTDVVREETYKVWVWNSHVLAKSSEMDLAPHCDSIWKNGCVLVKALELFMQLKLNLHWPKIRRYWREPGTIFARVAWVFGSVVSMHYFLLTYCGLGYVTKVQPPNTVHTWTCDCVFGQQKWKQFASLVSSVIDIFLFTSRHTQLTFFFLTVAILLCIGK